MIRAPWVRSAALLLVGCAEAVPVERPPPRPVAPRECPEFDPKKIGDLATLDKENEQNIVKVDTLQKTVDDLRGQLAKLQSGGAQDADPTHGVAQTGERVRVRLSNELLFGPGSARVSRGGREALKQIAEVFKQTPSKRIEVHGHTDATPVGGKWEDNWQLSCERARRVVAFLISQGIEAKRLVASGYGESDPLEAGDGQEARAKNRRVEIFIEPTGDETKKEGK